MPKNTPWSRLLAEGAVIIVSILLAFAIDALWADQLDRRREDAAVTQIAADFRQHRVVLDHHLASYEARLEATDSLLRVIGPDAEISFASIASTLATVGLASPAEFRSGTIEALAANEGLSLLRDPELRRQLSWWMQATRDLQGFNVFLTSEAQVMLDYLRTRVSIQDVDRMAGLADVPPSGFESNARDVLRDLEFSNIVYQQRYATLVIEAQLRNLSGIAESVLVLTGR